MKAKQQIFRDRRNYNKWVGNQTLEDFALRFTAKKARKLSASQVAITAIGAAAFMALEAIGGSITLSYGFGNAFAAILAVGLLLFITGLPISYYAAKYGVDIDLLTRGAGFGYLGSTVTSLIYASFTFIFFAIEAAILAAALEQLLGIPLFIGYIVSAIAVIPIVTHGITMISRFQVLTHYVWLVLQLGAIAALFWYQSGEVSAWTSYAPTDAAASFNVALFGAASAVLFALIAQIGEQADYLRFLPPRESTSGYKWWGAMLLAGPGWVFIGVIKLLVGSFLAYLAVKRGLEFSQASDPTQMYQIAFLPMVSHPQLALILAATMVIVCQMKINVTNAYAGSIAWSNFFSRITHSHPGRVVWLFFNVAIALMLMELGIFKALENILGMFAIVAISWLGSVSADLMINKTFGLSPKGIEFKRAHLYDVNPVGLGSMAVASLLGLVSYLGGFGDTVAALAHYLTLATTFVMVPLIAALTRGRYYIARESDLSAVTRVGGGLDSYECCICETEFETEDTSWCPAYSGPICSLCCSLDSRCQDMCKPHGRAEEQMPLFLRTFLPEKLVEALASRIGRFAVVFLLGSTVLGLLFALVYYHMATQAGANAPLVAQTLWILYSIAVIVAGVFGWILLLAHESRSSAQAESNRQTLRLLDEIDAHSVTDQALQDAKELAEAANLAKTRYLSGISHELRTPLQSILGYTQLLSRDPEIPARRKSAIDVMRRSGEHLADLIEGLLDISRIEAGRLQIRPGQVDLHELLNQLVSMFSAEARARGIVFNYECSSQLPRYVRTDEKQLRQVLINLLSNAVKFTLKGQVSFTVRYRFQVVEFAVVDTGVGLTEEQLELIFKPFERITGANQPQRPGTGLGLTIARLLTELMGGDLAVESTLGKGSRFAVTMMMSSIDQPVISTDVKKEIIGIEGEQRQLLVVDDEANHRQLIIDLLTPLGFQVHSEASAELCLARDDIAAMSLLLLDVSMGGMSGYQLAEKLRSRGIVAPIVMVSADATEAYESAESGVATGQKPYNDYISKPININRLLDKIARHAGVVWRYCENTVSEPVPSPPLPGPGESLAEVVNDFNHPLFEELRSSASMGYIKGVRDVLQRIRSLSLCSAAVHAELEDAARFMQFEQINSLVEPTASNTTSNTTSNNGEAPE